MMQSEGNRRDNVAEKQKQSQVIGLMGVHDVQEIGYIILLEHWETVTLLNP